MPKKYITQLNHFLDELGEVPIQMPTQGRRLAMFFGGVVAWVTKSTPGITDLTNMPCIEKNNDKPCLSQVMGTYDTETGEIFWECPSCEANGIITNWELTYFDRRGSRNRD